jgi:hypothetical protein
MNASRWNVVLGAAILVWPVVGSAQPLPNRERTCALSTVAGVEQRLRERPGGPFVAGSGSAIRFTNGGYQVAYAEIEAVQNSRTGDPVFICLIQIPRGCPAGDTRGRVYTTTNLRTLESWTMPDSEHRCRGA